MQRRNENETNTILRRKDFICDKIECRFKSQKYTHTFAEISH
jgi:hypothetical protein